ncbi:MAG TPA: fatty acid desaturase, partial [Gemmataceae bacterium]|nr:fatty acid desaturase [Gemmataceae bacterium]
IKDLSGDRYLNFLDRRALGVQAGLFLLLYALGELVGRGLGLSWAVYGACVAVAGTQQLAWLVNSASHSWGYQNFATRDRAMNCWWLMFPAMGEGWHNNHHANPRSAGFGVRWYEFDVGFAFIRLLRALRLAWDVVPPPRPPVSSLTAD